MRTGEYAVKQKKSYIYYKLQLDCNFKFGGATSKNGRLYLLAGAWYFQPYTFDTDHWYPTAIPPTCLGSGPWNAFCIVDSSNVNFSGINKTNEKIFRKMSVLQSRIPRDTQDNQNKTWFGGYKPSIVIDFLPHTVAAGVKTFVDTQAAATNDTAIAGMEGVAYSGATGVFNVSKTFTLELPLNLINDIYDQTGGLLYLNALRSGQFATYITLVQPNVQKVFGKSAIFNNTCNIKELILHLNKK